MYGKYPSITFGRVCSGRRCILYESLRPQSVCACVRAHLRDCVRVAARACSLALCRCCASTLAGVGRAFFSTRATTCPQSSQTCRSRRAYASAAAALGAPRLPTFGLDILAKRQRTGAP
eukprot:6203813-Pleurochrysis_carterae.AAC.1